MNTFPIHHLLAFWAGAALLWAPDAARAQVQDDDGIVYEGIACSEEALRTACPPASSAQVELSEGSCTPVEVAVGGTTYLSEVCSEFNLRITCNFAPEESCPCGLEQILDGAILCNECLIACGDGLCDGLRGENADNCSADCGALCAPRTTRCRAGTTIDVCGLNGFWEQVDCGAGQVCAHPVGDLEPQCIECDANNPPMWWIDRDGDGLGDSNGATVETCSPPTRFVSNNFDCDDAAYSPDLDDDSLCGGTCHDGHCPQDQFNYCMLGRCRCEPQCDGSRFGDDGCGGVCECPPGTTVNGATLDCDPDTAVFVSLPLALAACGPTEFCHELIEDTVDDFVIDLSPVTAESFIECVSNGTCVHVGAASTASLNGVSAVGRREDRGHEPPEAEREAITEVSWHDARAYCNVFGLRLPTEAELRISFRAEHQRVQAERRACRDECPNGRQGHACVRACRNEFRQRPMRRGGRLWEWTADPAGKRARYRAASVGEDGPPIDPSQRVVVGAPWRPLAWGHEHVPWRRLVDQDAMSRRLTFRCAQRFEPGSLQ